MYNSVRKACNNNEGKDLKVRVMKVLSIGNSFSQDSQRYLHQIAKNEGVALKCVNLYIGGCSLQTHYMNMTENKAAYSFELNGESLGLPVSIADALRSDNWDVVTLQQVSHLSPDYSTYIPYITILADFVRLYRPNARIMIHQTWSYEQDSKRLNEELGYRDQHEMFSDIEKAYKKASEAVSAAGIIPCGKVMMQAIDDGIGQIHRDTFHADLGVGRYMLGLTCFKALTGKMAICEFNEFDVDVDKAKLAIAIEAVKKAECFV